MPTVQLSATKTDVSSQNISIEELLKKSALFSSLTTNDLSPIARCSKKLTHPAGTALFSHGEPAEHFFLILSGSVRLYRLTNDGKEKVIEIIQSGETFAESVALVGKPYPVHGQTIETTEMIWIPSDILIGLLEEDTGLSMKIISGLSRRLHKFINDIHALSLSNAEQKLAGYFLAFLEDDDKIQRINLPSKKSVIASRLGLQPETFSRALRKMKGREVITEDEQGIVVLEPKKLKELWESE